MSGVLIGDQIITHEQAKRLAGQYAAGALTPLAVLFWSGRILPTSLDRIRAEGAMGPSGTGRDPQGFQADMRALADYFAMRVEYGATIYTGGDWAEVKSYGTKADEVVPWSYGR